MYRFESGEKVINHIVIDEKKCIGCGLCEKDCPNAYIYLENQKAHTNNTGCIECGHCFAICPKNAIQMKAYDCADEPVS